MDFLRKTFMPCNGQDFVFRVLRFSCHSVIMLDKKNEEFQSSFLGSWTAKQSHLKVHLGCSSWAFDLITWASSSSSRFTFSLFLELLSNSFDLENSHDSGSTYLLLPALSAVPHGLHQPQLLFPRSGSAEGAGWMRSSQLTCHIKIPWRRPCDMFESS